jgi:hypothetical protein
MIERAGCTAGGISDLQCPRAAEFHSAQVGESARRLKEPLKWRGLVCDQASRLVIENCNSSYSGPLTETVLLGVLAQRAPGQRLQWDGKNLQVKNMPELNQFVHKEYRQGWDL